MSIRKRPLLVLYYPEIDGVMSEWDIEYCYAALRHGGGVFEDPFPTCDVLLHTNGGHPMAGYRLAQCIRDFALEVTFLVPKQAYSAGTLLTFAGNGVRLGHCAGLSPIDVTVVEQRPSGRAEVQLAGIESFLEFSADAQRVIQEVLATFEITDVSVVSAELLTRMVDQVGALKVGDYYRARTITGHYAQELLGKYMLEGKPNGAARAELIIQHFLFDKPAHDFHMDFHLCCAAGLEVAEMGTLESDATKTVVGVLRDMAHQSTICQRVAEEYCQPFFALYRPEGTP